MGSFVFWKPAIKIIIIIIIKVLGFSASYIRDLTVEYKGIIVTAPMNHHEKDDNLSLYFQSQEIILYIHPANERWHYNVTLFLIGWAHPQNDP